MTRRLPAIGCALLAGLAAAAPWTNPSAARAAATPALREAVDAGDLSLRRAAHAWRTGEPGGVIEALDAVDFAAPGFEGADRAAFLLAQAYLETGDLERFSHLAEQTAAWPEQTAWTRWLGYQRILIDAERQGADGVTPGPSADESAGSGDAVAADRLLGAGRTSDALERLSGIGGRGPSAALALYVRSLAQTAAGMDDRATLEALAEADTLSVLGRDLAGLARIRLATQDLAAGRDPRPQLDRVPATSLYTARAMHMRGVHALESGDRTTGESDLSNLLERFGGYEDRREAMLALAGLALEDGVWRDAYARYLALDEAWRADANALEAIVAESAYTPLWDAWRRGRDAGALLLDGAAVHAASRVAAGDALEAGGRPGEDPPVLERAGLRAGPRAPAPPPPPADWRRLAEARRAMDQNGATLAATRRAIEAERARLAAERAYFGHGAADARSRAALIGEHGRMLDSLGASLDQLDARLRAVRDASIERITRRARELAARGGAHLAWLGAMRTYHLDGAHHDSERRAPEGVPSPDSLVRAEDDLARALVALAEAMRAGAPELIARSYDQAWRPGLIDRTSAQGARARLALVWARRIASAADSSAGAAASSTTLVALEAEAARLEQRALALASAHAQRADSIAQVAVQRALAALALEREGIDYGLATAAYGLATGLERDAAGASAGTIPPDSADAARGPLRAEGVGRLEAFLTRHPESAERAAMRFRLADLLLIDAREGFEEKMAAFVEAQAAGRETGPPPVLEHGPALELYASILAEDPGFEHRDAVLFNAGMILADGGDPAAERYFADLVRVHPGSVYRQESWLRMGDMRFNARDHAAAVAHYAAAAQGGDPNLRAIALYKMGWAHSNEDRFMDAADAFRAALDLYGSDARAAIRADVEKESETYLVHSLARAGGAAAFTAYFERIGERPYARRILASIAGHFRRYSLFEEAAAADAAFIARYPLHPEALASAQNLPETWLRAGRPEAARAAQLEQAPRFAPGSAWAKAQEADSMRTAGEDFARRAWTTVALHRHLEARTKGAKDDWTQALALYGTLIHTWPDDPATPEYQLFAGEASDHLGDPRTALAHYRAAADAGADSIAERALRQRVAVTDAWYERMRAGRATGSDSLARAVHATADELLERFPAHEGGADIRWREGQLSLAHGWHERAAEDFGRMATAYPDDPRAPRAASLRADALFRIERYDAAGDAFEAAHAAAVSAGDDSLAARAAAAVPVCHFRHAESVARAEPKRHREHAELFARVATRWPEYEHAHVAQYRAGLAWIAAQDVARGVAAMQGLIERFPQSEYVRDAHLQIAATLERDGDLARSAEAYAAFAERFTEDSLAANAWLRAADLFDSSGAAPRAESIRLAYIERYPDDHATALEILEPLARRELAGAGPARPVSALLAPAKGAPATRLAQYVARARAHPALASRDLLAEVRWLEAEEARPGYEAARLTLPLDRSIAKRQAALDTLLARYGRAAGMGIPRFAHAASFRIGEALIGFGEALEASERPADISGDDRLAYEDVLLEKSQAFYDRGEGVWEELLRLNTRGTKDDEWIAQAREALWKRLGQRFYFQPEVEFPLIEEKAPAAEARAAKGTAAGTPAVAQREDTAR